MAKGLWFSISFEFVHSVQGSEQEQMDSKSIAKY